MQARACCTMWLREEMKASIALPNCCNWGRIQTILPQNTTLPFSFIQYISFSCRGGCLNHLQISAPNFVKTVKLLLAHKHTPPVNVNATDVEGQSVIHKLLKGNDHDPIDALGMLVNCEKAGSPPDLKLKDKAGKSALHYAAASNALMCCRLLLKHKVPLDEEDRDGNTPLVISTFFFFFLEL